MPAGGSLKSGQGKFWKQVMRSLQQDEEDRSTQEWRAASEDVGVSTQRALLNKVRFSRGLTPRPAPKDTYKLIGVI